MASALDILGTIVKPGTVAAISLTGLISAFAVALLLWPPAPRDVLHLPAAQDATQILDPADCRLRPVELRKASDPGDFKSIAVDNQATLDQGAENVQHCIDLMNSKMGVQDTLNAQLKDEMAVIKAEQTSAQTNYLTYQKAGSPLQHQSLRTYNTDTERIHRIEAEIIRNEQTKRDLQLVLDTDTQFQKVLSFRLQDPGRLRPTHSFDEVLNGLANHIVAFLGLAAVIGTPVQMLQRTFLGVFDDWLDEN